MNILRKAVKALSLNLLYYEIFEYLPMSLVGGFLLLRKAVSKKIFSKF